MRRSDLQTINLRFLGDDRRVLARSSNTLALHDDPAGGAGGAGGSGGSGGTITVMPSGNTVAPLSAVEQASAAARERLATTGSSLPAGTAIVDDQAKPARASDGTFAEKSPAEIEAENQRRAAEAASQTPEQKEQARVAAEAAEQQRLAARTPEQVQADEEAAARVVEIALAEGESPLPIEFDDPAIAAHVRERFELAAQAEQITTQAQQQIDEVMMVREAVNVDPVGFVLSEIGNTPAAVSHLVLSLVTADTPEAAALRTQIAKLATDANELRAVRGEQKGARAEYAAEATGRIAEERAVSQNLTDVRTVCAALLPRDLTPERQRVAFADMLRDVQQYATRHDLTTIEPMDLPLVLRPRLAALGVDAVVAAQQAEAALAAKRTGKGAPKARSGGTATARAVAGAAPAARTGSSFVASTERRRAVAVPGVGAGSPSASPAELVPPLNPDGSKMTSEQTIAWHRGQLKKGIRHY